MKCPICDSELREIGDIYHCDICARYFDDMLIMMPEKSVSRKPMYLSAMAGIISFIVLGIFLEYINTIVTSNFFVTFSLLLIIFISIVIARIVYGLTYTDEHKEIDREHKEYLGNRKFELELEKQQADIPHSYHCPSCQELISNKAESCPHCGYVTGVHVCPKCGSVDTRIISGTNKAASVLVFGVLAANNVVKTYKCNKCGTKF